MSNTHNLEIDVDLKENLIITATCKQLDDLNLTFNVWNNGEMVDLSEYKCRLKAFKQDQIPLIQNTSININNNVVNIIADEQFTTTSGTVKVELQFINKNTGKKKSTFNIIFKVMQSVLEVERSISKATCTLLKEIDYKLDQIEDIKLDIIEAVKVKNDLNTSRTDANDMNNKLKTTTTNADNKKKEVETAINNASNKIKEVQDSTNAANTAKQAVDSSVVQANASKQALDTSKVNADNTKKEVDNSIK
ncbi:viral A-type inclusion protein, partial [Clostridium botulinum]|nr:viral A-type inclusion protein [Clostridium botulinum]NFG22154.1 viral A-type inclusion protein [Clostridium botulinum]